jgi:hypothetical protein
MAFATSSRASSLEITRQPKVCSWLDNLALSETTSWRLADLWSEVTLSRKGRVGSTCTVLCTLEPDEANVSGASGINAVVASVSFGF